MCVVYDGYTKAEACIAGSKFRVFDNGKNVESPCRLKAVLTQLND